MGAFTSIDFSLHQMRLFLAIAEEKSFARVSEKFHLEPSTISRKIRLLEQELGVELFHRCRPLQLTVAGNYLYDAWKDIICSIDASLQFLAQQNQNIRSQLNVCSADSCSTEIFCLFASVSKELLKSYPRLNVHFDVFPLEQCYQKLHERSIDVLVGPTFSDLRQEKFLASQELARVKQMACMLPGNPLAKRTHIKVSDLKGQRFVVFKPNIHSVTTEKLISICKQHGFEPHIAKKVSNVHELLTSLQGNDEIFLCDCFMRAADIDSFRLVPIDDLESGISVYWYANKQNPGIALFVNTITEKSTLKQLRGNAKKQEILPPETRN